MKSDDGIRFIFAVTLCIASFTQGAALAQNPQFLRDSSRYSQYAANVSKLDRVALNPQPLPPDPPPQMLDRMLQKSKQEMMKRAAPELVRQLFDYAALNPQPLPPRAQSGNGLFDRVNKGALNPQPLPPRSGLSTPFNGRFDKSALNPQPLPPRVAF